MYRPGVDELRRALAAQERSQAWLARKTGFDPSYVTLILQGRRRATPAFQEAAAAALGVPPSELFPAEGVPA